MNTIKVTLNGEERLEPVGTSIADILERYGLTPGQVAVERNLEIVPRSEYASCVLADGDTIEIVHFVGGG